MDNFTPSSNERKTFILSLFCFFSVNQSLTLNHLHLAGNLISHIFRENEICRDAEWERYFCYKNIEVPEIYSGPHLTFPLTVEEAVGLVEAFRNKKVGLFGENVLHSSSARAINWLHCNVKSFICSHPSYFLYACDFAFSVLEAFLLTRFSPSSSCTHATSCSSSWRRGNCSACCQISTVSPPATAKKSRFVVW